LNTTGLNYSPTVLTALTNREESFLRSWQSLN